MSAEIKLKISVDGSEKTEASLRSIGAAAEAAGQRAAQAFRGQIAQSAEREVDKVVAAWKTLGVRSSSVIADEARKMRDAFKSLRSAGLEGPDLDRASSALKQQFAALRQEMDRAGKTNAFAESRKGADMAAGAVDRLTEKVRIMGHLGAALTIAPQVVQSLAQMGGSLIAAQQAADKLANSLSYSVGAANVAREMDYLRTTARNLGLDYQSAAEGYSKFSAAVKGSGMTLAQTREVFEGVAQATARFGLSADDTKGAFLALSQMASKGVVSAEEFRQQLAERLPGATQIAARALGVTTAEFNKLLESGSLIASDFLPKFGAALKNEITAPVNSLTQEINRLTGAWEQWKQALANADGGGFQWLTNGLNESAAAMRSLGKEAGVVQKLLMAIGGFEAGAIGAVKFDTAKVQEQAMAKLGGVISQRRALEGLGSRTAFESEALRGLISEEQALRDQLMQLAERRGKETAVLPDIAQEYKDQQSKRRTAFDAYMKDVQGEKQKQIAAEIERFSALTAVIGSSGKDYEAAYAAHQAKLAELRKGKGTGAGAAKNDAAETFAARLKEEQDYAKTAVEIIQEKVKQQVFSEREGIEQMLAAQQAGMVAQAKLLNEQLAGTSDSGQREKIKAQIVALGNDAAVAAEKAASGFAKIDQAATAASQKVLAGLADETNSLLLKAKAAEEENATIGMTADQLAELTRQRYDERIALLQTEADRLSSIADREAERYVIEQQISALTRLRNAEIVRPKLREQAREWERFSEDIGRSLTDSLFRAFEAGGSFGKTFAKTLENTLKASLSKMLINVAITTGSNALNSGINALLGTSGANGGNGTNYLGLANGASSIYNLGSAAYGLYTNGLNYTLGSAVSSAGSYMGSLGTQAFGAGLANGGNVGTAISLYNSAAYTAAMEGVAAQASASAAQAAGNSAAAQAAAELAASKAAESAAYTATAEGLAAGSGANSTLSALSTYVGELASGPVGWVVAILTSMYQSNKLFKEGITWSNFTEQNKDKAQFWLNEPGVIRSIMDRDLAIILGEDFVNSEFHQTVSLGSLAAALTTWFNGGLFGNTGQRGSVLAGSFSEDEGGFTGRSGAQMKKTGGLFSSSKEWTDWSDLPKETDLLFDVLYASVRGGFAGLGQAFKDPSLMGGLKGFEYSYSGSGTDMEAYVKDMTEQLTIAMGKTLLPSIEGLAITTEENGKKITETWNQTFQRVVTEANAVNTVFDLLGNSLSTIYGNNTDKILAASDAFVKLFGSIDAMSASINAYYENFYSEEEKRQRKLEQIQQRLSAAGLNVSVAEIDAANRDTFRSVADALLKQGDAGAVAFKALMDVQSAFADLHPVIDATAEAAKLAAAEADALARANAAAADAARAAAEAAAENAALVAESLLSGFAAEYAAANGMADRQMSYIREQAQQERTQREAALREAAGLERDRIDAARAAATEQVSLIESIMDALKRGIVDMRGEVESTRTQAASVAMQFIADAARAAQSSGYLPDAEALADALSAARAGMQSAVYASSFERDFEKLALAGNLESLRNVAGQQLPVAQQALNAAKQQITLLDQTLDADIKALSYYDSLLDSAEDQLNALRGIDTGIGGLTGSLESMISTMISTLSSKQQAIATAAATQAIAGAVDSKSVAEQAASAGVPTDQWVLAGGKQIAISSQGAIAERSQTGEVSITANTGWRGSLDDAKRIVAEAFYAMTPADFYASAKKVGLSSTFIDEMYGLKPGTALAWAKSNNLPAFAQGANRIPQDMLAVVHKDEAIIPAAYNPALGNSGNTRLERLVEAMTLEIQRLNTDLAEMRRDTRRTANAVNGNPEQPMLVETVA